MNAERLQYDADCSTGNAQQTFLLSDYGAAKQWMTGDEMMPAVTEEFSSLPGEFVGTGNLLFL